MVEGHKALRSSSAEEMACLNVVLYQKAASHLRQQIQRKLLFSPLAPIGTIAEIRVVFKALGLVLYSCDLKFIVTPFML